MKHPEKKKHISFMICGVPCILRWVIRKISNSCMNYNFVVVSIDPPMGLAIIAGERIHMAMNVISL